MINKITTLIVATVLSVAFMSCSQAVKETKEEKPAVEAEAPVAEAHDHEHSDQIQLNGTEKWKVVSGMIGYIRAMETAVNETAESDPKDYATLATLVDVQLDSLTSNCTMEGQAHDELHKWLVPFMETADELLKAENDLNASTSFTQMQAAFAKFNLFFE